MVIAAGDYAVMKLSRGFLASLKRPGKKAVIWSGIAILLVVITGYVLWSQQLWAQYQPSYMQWRHDIHTEVDSAVALPTATEDERAAVIAKFADIAQHVEDVERVTCWVSPVVAWQANIVDSLADARADCQSAAADMKGFEARLQSVIAYLQDDQALAVIMAISQPDELADDEWPAQVQIWTKAVQSTKGLSVSDNFKPVQELAIAKMTSIKTAWENAVAAHKAKDKKQYLAAQAALAGAYDGMYDVAGASEKIGSELSAELQKTFTTAFSTTQ